MTAKPFAVFDDWLSAAELARLRRFLSGYRYFTTTELGKRGPIGTLEELAPRLAAGELKLLGGSFVVYRADPSMPTERTLYPSGTDVDLVLDSVRARMTELEPWLGRERLHWQLLGAGPRLYPQGRGMAEHDDARFVGTFTLYTHERWEPAFGGLLEIGQTLIEPRPNRLVALAAGVPHRVRPVAPEAGPWLRSSVIGYTYRRKDAD